MATGIVGQHQISTFVTPVNGTSPIDANSVRGNDNTIKTSYDDHDNDATIHLQSSDLASRPAAGVAGRKWITSDAYRLYYDDGSAWHEAAYLPSGGGTIAGNVTITGTLGVTGVVTGTGGFVGALTGAVTGNASTATILQTTRTINGVGFNGSADITIPTTLSHSLTAGTHLSGGPFDGSAAVTLTTDATNANTNSTIVARDGSGNFSAGTITAALSGNATTATSASSASAVPASGLTGSTLASGVTASSLTSLGTIAALTATTAKSGQTSVSVANNAATDVLTLSGAGSTYLVSASFGASQTSTIIATVNGDASAASISSAIIGGTFSVSTLTLRFLQTSGSTQTVTITWLRLA